jgi:LysM repeat protein
MKTISVWSLILVFAAALMPGRAQESATQQQIDKLTGQLQDMTDTVESQRKHIEALEKEISELREKVDTPVANDYVNRDDLRKVVDQMNDIDKKRQDDRELILAQIQKLANAPVALPPPQTHHSEHSNITPGDTGSGNDTSAAPDKGHYYEVKKGDSLSLIVKAYQDQGVKVTMRQVLKANPGLDPNKLYAGKKIFIPDPAVK